MDSDVCAISQQIHGLRADGTRRTLTIPAGAFGNVGPINVVTKRWESPELKIVLESRRSDPRLGDVMYRVVHPERGEPAADLFTVSTTPSSSGRDLQVHPGSNRSVATRGGSR